MARSQTMTPEKAASMVEKATIKGAKITARVVAHVNKAQTIANQISLLTASPNGTPEKRLIKISKLLTKLQKSIDSAQAVVEAKPCGSCAD